MRLIDADVLLEKVREIRKLALDRAVETPANMPFPIYQNPAYTRYSTQADEREKFKVMIEEAPSVQPETNRSEIPNNSDTISRQQAIDKFIDELEEIFSDIREREVDDSVCGLCEYDGAYIGQSGDWCNECPGFDRDDCFKLSDKTRKEWTDEIIKALPSVQPETAKRIVGKSRGGMTLWYQCDMCNEPVDEHDNFCRGCGRRLIDETD